MEQPDPGGARLHPVHRFFLFCSGANRRVLEQCPESEHIKYASIGATVFFTGLLAAFSGGYALYTVLNALAPAMAFGLFWGAIIFNLDRFIVSTIKKDGSLQRQLLTALPRFGLAAVLAVVIARPLELRIFQPEILEVIDQRKTEKLALLEAGFQARIREKEADVARLRQETEAMFQLRETHYREYRCECDGTCGTGRVGRGTECERKEAKYLKTDREYQERKTANERETAALRRAMTAIEAEAEAAREETGGRVSYGLLARLSAAGELPPGPGLFLTLLILFIEISPILAKILAPRGPYDELLSRIEQRFYLDQLEDLNRRKLELDKNVSLLSTLHKAQIEQEVHQRRETMRAIADAHLSLVKDQIDEWLKKEREKRKG